MLSPSVVKYSQRKCYKVTLGIANNNKHFKLTHISYMYMYIIYLLGLKGPKVTHFCILSTFKYTI